MWDPATAMACLAMSAGNVSIAKTLNPNAVTSSLCPIASPPDMTPTRISHHLRSWLASLPSAPHLALVGLLQVVGDVLEDAQAGSGVGGLPQQASPQALVQASHSILSDDVLGHRQLHRHALSQPMPGCGEAGPPLRV